MTDYIRLDIVPATVEVQGGDGTVYGTTRTIVTNDEVRVYVDAYGGPQVIEEVSGPLADITGNNKIGYTIVIDDGPTLLMNRSRGCACGSLLRSINPFPGVGYVGMKE